MIRQELRNHNHFRPNAVVVEFDLSVLVPDSVKLNDGLHEKAM